MKNKQKVKDLLLEKFNSKEHEEIVKQAAIEGAKDQGQKVNPKIPKEDGITLENWELRLRRDGIYAIEDFITQLLAEKDKEIVEDLERLIRMYDDISSDPNEDETEYYSNNFNVELDNLLKKYKGEK